ncbi:MAG: hypothetical protein AAFX07_08265 [Pseudomonadota bacterium]
MKNAAHLYKQGKEVHWHHVADSREGWGWAIEAVEITTYRNGMNRQKIKRDNRINVLIIDFTDVRPEGSPIIGMQGRPSSGPVPLMDAIGKIAKVKGTGLKPWLATLYIDHYLAEPVLVGGARRSARMSTKDWRDEDILEFIGIKRPVEYDGLTMDEVITLREELAAQGLPVPMSFLWSSNNSVAVDADFWERVHGPITSDPLTVKAKMVHEYAVQCGYGDATGEPGFINVDRLGHEEFGLDDEVFVEGRFMDSKKYPLKSSTSVLLKDLHERFQDMPYHLIVNPCGSANYGRHTPN